MIHKLFYQKSITIAGFQKMQIDRTGKDIETMKIFIEDQSLQLGFI